MHERGICNLNQRSTKNLRDQDVRGRERRVCERPWSTERRKPGQELVWLPIGLLHRVRSWRAKPEGGNDMPRSELRSLALELRRRVAEGSGRTKKQSGHCEAHRRSRAR